MNFFVTRFAITITCSYTIQGFVNLQFMNLLRSSQQQLTSTLP